MTDMFVGSTYSAGPPPSVRVIFKDPSRANQTVSVTISDGGNDPREVEIALDANGDGDHDELIGTGWLTILLEEGGSEDHTIVIP